MALNNLQSTYKISKIDWRWDELIIVGFNFRRDGLTSESSISLVKETLSLLRIYSYRFHQLKPKTSKDIQVLVKSFQEIQISAKNHILENVLAYIEGNKRLVENFILTLNAFFLEHKEILEFFQIDIEGGSEGKSRISFHRFRERNQKIILAKKNLFIKENGSLFCEACNFDFHSVYGDRGRNFAEVHHNIPLSNTYEVTRTKLKDLSILCSNCHRIIHRGEPWLTMKELQNIIKKELAA